MPSAADENVAADDGDDDDDDVADDDGDDGDDGTRRLAKPNLT